MLELGELDLELALVAAGALGEDLEDEVGAVEDPHALAALGQGLLEVADLGGGERMVEDDGAGVVQAADVLELLDLAGAGVGRGVGTVAAAGDDLADVRTRALDEARRFLGAIGLAPLADLQADEDGARAARGRGGQASGECSDGTDTGLAGTTVEMACL